MRAVDAGAGRASAVLRRLGVGDAVLALVVLAVARQWTWWIGDARVAWVVAAALATAAFVALVGSRRPVERPNRVFWAIVGVPLVALYALRAAVPDMSWDVLDYRLVNGELGLRGWPLRTGDYFASRFPFNPAPDMAMGIARHLLGYRLGTIVNLGALLWTGLLIDAFLRRAVPGPAVRAACTAVVLLVEQLLFEASTYLVDVLAVPLLLEATLAAVDADDVDERARRTTLVRTCALLGLALACKTSNAAFALPILVVACLRLGRRGRRVDHRALAAAAVALAMPLVPYTVHVAAETGNPVFPLANDVFRSPYWPAPDPRPERWGPVVDDVEVFDRTPWEVAAWPVVMPFQVDHTGGDLGPTWGRISVVVLAAGLVLVVARRADRSTRRLAAVVVAGSLLWSIGSGMHRYGIYLELVGGVVVVRTLAAAWSGMSRPRAPARRALAGALGAVLVVQAGSSVAYAYRFEHGGRRPFPADPSGHLEHLGEVLRDRDPAAYLTPRDRALIDGVDAWVTSGPLTAGYQLLLRPDVPQWTMYVPELLGTPTARQRLADAIDRSQADRMHSLVLEAELVESLTALREAGVDVGRITPMSLTFFSPTAGFHAARLVEVLARPPTGPAPARSAGTAPLADDAMSSSLRWSEPPPTRLAAGETTTVYVDVRNVGDETWPALGAADGRYAVAVGNRWFAADGAHVGEDGRAGLPLDVVPGGDAAIALPVRAPAEPGRYVLDVDVLQEGVSWFGDRGWVRLRTVIEVG